MKNTHTDCCAINSLACFSHLSEDMKTPIRGTDINRNSSSTASSISTEPSRLRYVTKVVLLLTVCWPRPLLPFLAAAFFFFCALFPGPVACVLHFKKMSSGGWVKIKLKLPHFHVPDTCVSIYPGVPVAAAARAAATGRVSMSTRPDPKRSGAVEIASRRCPCLRVVWDLARAHPLTKTQAMEPSRQIWSSYGPPYLPVGTSLVLIRFTACPNRIETENRKSK